MKFFYLTLISCFLILSCESDDSPYQSNALIADYKVQLLDDITENFEFSFSNEDGIFGLIRSKDGSYKEAVQIQKDGTIETLFSLTTLEQFQNINPAKLAGIKHTSSETLETTELYLLLNNKIYKYQKNDKSLRFYREFEEENRIANFSHVPNTDYFICLNNYRNSIGYFSILSNDSQYQLIESTIGKAYHFWDSDEPPVLHTNSLYFLNRAYTSSIFQMTYTEFNKTPSFKFNTIKANVSDSFSNLQIDSNGELYAHGFIIGLVHLNMEKELPVAVFLSGSAILKYKIQYKNSSETDLLDIFERQNSGPGRIINTIKHYFILDKDLYIVKNKDVIKISNFNEQLLITKPI